MSFAEIGKLLDKANTDERPTINITDSVILWVDRTGYINFYDHETDTRLFVKNIYHAMAAIGQIINVGFKTASVNYHDLIAWD